jgi:twitching motility protein PilT
MDRAALDEMLASMARCGGSTLHLSPGHAPYMRVLGKLVIADDAGPLDGDAIVEVTTEFLFADHFARLNAGEEVCILYSTESGDRFRATILRQARGLGVVFRRVPDHVPTFAELELPELLDGFCAMRRGLVLVTGFHGSGRSTTLAAMVDRVNEDRAVHLVTIEPQIEYVHTARRSVVHQRQVGTHVESIGAGVREAFQQGAEVLAVGDLPDGDALRAVLNAVERGLLVFAVCEASGVAGAIANLPRLVAPEQKVRVRHRLADGLRAAVAQVLIPRRHGNGRVPLIEVLVRNEASARAIRRGRPELLHDVMMRGRGLGMQTTDLALRNLLNRHLITPEEAAHHAVDRDWVCGRGAVL